MRTLKLIGGPLDGKVIDTDRVCNLDNEYCPAHGHRYRHLDGRPSVLMVKEAKYNNETGEFEGYA